MEYFCHIHYSRISMLCYINCQDLLEVHYYFFGQNHSMKTQSQISQVYSLTNNISKHLMIYLSLMQNHQIHLFHSFLKTFLIRSLGIKLSKYDEVMSNLYLLLRDLKERLLYGKEHYLYP